MINYRYSQLENGDWEIYNTDKESTMFILSEEQDADGNFVRGFAEHAQMIKDFEDKSKLEFFISLLEADPGTAFTIYNSQR